MEDPLVRVRISFFANKYMKKTLFQLYWLGPLTGAVLATYLYRYLFSFNYKGDNINLNNKN